VLSRRTRASIQDARAALAAADAVAAILVAELGWTRSRRRNEVGRFRERVEAELEAAGLRETAERTEAG
jgi:glycerol-3-phosphate dehydrogenase